MLMDIAIMLFAMGLPVALYILLRNPDGTPAARDLVRCVALLSIIIAAICLYDCYQSSKSAMAQLQSLGR